MLGVVSHIFGLGSHTYDKIAQLIDGVIEEYGIHSKVSHMVTDNGSNFVKAFKEFSVSSHFVFMPMING